MRKTIGNFDYLKNEENIIDVCSWDGECDMSVARCVKLGNRIIIDIPMDNDYVTEIRDTCVKIFNGEISLQED